MVGRARCRGASPPCGRVVGWGWGGGGGVGVAIVVALVELLVLGVEEVGWGVVGNSVGGAGDNVALAH